MGEGHIQKYTRGVQLRISAWILLSGASLIGAYYGLLTYTDFDTKKLIIILLVLTLVLAFSIGTLLGRGLSQPTQFLAQTIMHLSPSEHLVTPPNLEKIHFGRALAANLSRQIFEFATVAANSSGATEVVPASLFEQLPIAVIGIDEKGNISLANAEAIKITKMENLSGQPFMKTLQLLSEDEDDIISWLRNVSENSLKGLRLWNKVEVKDRDNNSLGYFDIAVSYNKHSSSGSEALLALFDHSDAYSEESSSISFVSLAVHEMRTPLTVMRGYIEAFREEIGQNASSQLAEDLRRMSVSADTLASFVSNILNVARINQGQLALKLQEENWNTVLPQIVDTLRDRAAAYGKTIELRMQPDMPNVAIDRMTISEVVTNLVDNAIKYSPDESTKIIIVSQLKTDGQIETSVQDFGVGIPESVVPNLFSKFYRNHRTKASVGGTGLGLFLSKTIVNAHNGNIWVRSKEHEGSTFAFTLLPFEQLAKDQQTNNNENIVRSSHGWIKNHSLQRR